MIDFILTLLLWIIPVCALVVALFGILGLIRINVVYNHHDLISEAIYLYALDTPNKSERPAVWFSDIEPAEQALKRWWDWGYKRILPPEKFEIIKPYIPKAKEKMKNG